MAISTDTLFHFPNARQHLTDILAQGFLPRYCLEDFSPLGNVTEDIDEQRVAFPFVCFCDIPLSQAQHHFEVYGRYALGLTKEWGITKGITPVLYAHGNSAMTRLLPIFRERVKAGDVNDPIVRYVIQVMCHLKPHEGTFWRRGRRLPNVRFYDEREWRFVPSNVMDLEFLSLRGFNDESVRASANRDVEHLALSFTPRDLRYVIVDSADDIPIINRELEQFAAHYRPQSSGVTDVMPQILQVADIRNF